MCADAHRARPPCESGATLIVALVLLVVLTVLGVSGLRTSAMELRMAANAEFQDAAFQLAENAIEVLLATRDSAGEADLGLDLASEPSFDGRVMIADRGLAAVPDAAFGAGELEAHHFDVTAEGRDARQARSIHTQSFYVVDGHLVRTFWKQDGIDD
jgi:hypothetical protein